MMNSRLSSLKFPTTYNNHGATKNIQCPDKPLYGFPGIVYIKRGGIHSCGKCHNQLPVPAVYGAFSRLDHIAAG